MLASPRMGVGSPIRRTKPVGPRYYIRSFPNATGKYLVSTPGGAKPEWRRDGRELFYLSPDRQLMAAPVTLGATVIVDIPVKLFAISANPSGFGSQYGSSDREQVRCTRSSAGSVSHICRGCAELAACTRLASQMIVNL
jgi:hypothetical protein